VEDMYNADRIELLSPVHLIHIMNLKRGSTVVDLGAGFGVFTFPLARAVGEEGKVFATDGDSYALAWVKKKAKREHMKNVITVQVSPDRLDPFYKKHKFDLIFVCDVLPLIEKPESLFSGLNESLQVDSGRLWIVEMRPDPDFTLWEFRDIGLLFSSLRSLDEHSPVLRRFRTEVRNAVKGSSASGSEALAAEAIEDLNRMLNDSTLWPEILRGKSRLSKSEKNLELHIARVSSPSFAQRRDFLLEPQIFVVHRGHRMLNRLVLQEQLGTHRWEKSFGSHGFLSEPPPLFEDCTIWETKPDYTTLFRKTGFTLVKKHEELPYFYVWEYKRER